MAVFFSDCTGSYKIAIPLFPEGEHCTGTMPDGSPYVVNRNGDAYDIHYMFRPIVPLRHIKVNFIINNKPVE